jgi:hypothetical protein
MMTAKSSFLKDALAAHRASAGDSLDPKVAAMLDRLAASKEAAQAFETILVGDSANANRLLRACLETEELARTFKRNKSNSELIAEGGRLDRLDKAVKELRSFVEETCRESTDQLEARIHYDREDIANINRGLHIVDDMIDVRRRVAKETMPRLGATRKLADGGKAGQTAAIGWLAASVRRISQQAHHGAVADLAQVILDSGVVTIDRVSKAELKQGREWRAPAGYARSG